MKKQFLIYKIILLCLLTSCASSKKTTAITEDKNNVLNNLMRQNHELLKNVLDNKDTMHLQIIYTKIDRDKNNKPSLTDYYYNVNSENYFYPASTVKMPTAFLALQKLNEINKPGVDANAIMVTDSNYSRQEVIYNSATSKDGIPSIANYIKQIFLVSDNNAFNRLYEFLGQEYLNKTLRDKGYSSAEIIHRLNVFLTEKENRNTNPVRFYDTSGNVIYDQPGVGSKLIYNNRNNRVGKGFSRGSQLVNEPFNFSTKNRISLVDLHHILRSVIFPESVSEKQRFNLTANDYALIYK